MEIQSLKPLVQRAHRDDEAMKLHDLNNSGSWSNRRQVAEAAKDEKEMLEDMETTMEIDSQDIKLNGKWLSNEANWQRRTRVEEGGGW